jgi:hypothetical protein
MSLRPTPCCRIALQGAHSIQLEAALHHHTERLIVVVTMIKSNLRTCTSKMVMSHRETALHRARFIQQHTKRLINVVTMVKSKLRTFMSKMTM